MDLPGVAGYSSRPVTNSNRRGCLITVEGIDGAGKSTQVARLADLLAARGHRLVSTHEPGATALGREIRRVSCSAASSPSRRDAELLLFLADRAEHVATVITPALARRRDRALRPLLGLDASPIRATDASSDLARVRRWDARERAGLEPDLTLLLDCPLELGAARRQRETDRYQVLDRAFHERVREGFPRPGGGRARTHPTHRRRAASSPR